MCRVVSVVACPPDGAACTPVVPAPATGRYLPGETPVGTTFEVRVDDTAVERSPAWTGRVIATAVPTVSGTIEVGQTAIPVGGAWTGGWGDERSVLDLLACATPEGTGRMLLPRAADCLQSCLTPEVGKVFPSRGERAALPAVAAGRYLIAVDVRYPRDQRGWPVAQLGAWTPLAYSSTATFSTRGPAAQSAPIQIRVPAPVVGLRQNAQRVKGKVRLGSIACRVTCKVSMKVSGGRVKASTTTFTVTGSRLLTTPPGRHGELTVRIHVDGQLAKTGKVIAR